jgi:hypothetical protein
MSPGGGGGGGGGELVVETMAEAMKKSETDEL